MSSDKARWHYVFLLREREILKEITPTNVMVMPQGQRNKGLQRGETGTPRMRMKIKAFDPTEMPSKVTEVPLQLLFLECSI